jgi:hypothetical protein
MGSHGDSCSTFSQTPCAHRVQDDLIEQVEQRLTDHTLPVQLHHLDALDGTGHQALAGGPVRRAGLRAQAAAWPSPQQALRWTGLPPALMLNSRYDPATPIC